ncbi:alanine--tRNA ligase-related protein [Natrarchaeobius chitinivorans]|uniref:Alanyl-tRNA editing protein n=1 Tax=Natrarchaeobius chitinivorans TaxID=1679083 RepID=A0A3N6N1S3_NATCH|nr:alanyl-tRNA editing protein [Natrarchaeobius chitinivorans]RQG91942.1 alanyl-tRNA editing protein [Natrarchaeobius chitinivorans]
MSGQLAAAEPYATRFETEVTGVDGRRVWLERSYFYGESGGQPADRGTVGDTDVVDVQVVDGEQVHVLETEPSFRPGQRVLCSVDWSFRMYCMRAHTASHVLYGAGRRVLDDLGYGGFDIGETKVRVDLETSTEIDDDALIELDELVNRAVWESRPVSWEEVPVEEARRREDVAFNEATEADALRKGKVRLVTIGDDSDGGGRNGRSAAIRTSGGTTGGSAAWDVAACGGTHVRNTREIGPVTVLGRSNPGEGLTRVEFAVGPNAIDRRTAEKRSVFAAQRTLETGIDDLTAELERLSDERDELADRVRARERELIATRLEHADSLDREGERWRIATVGEVESDLVGDVVRDRITDREGTNASEDVIVALGESGSTFAVVGTAESRSATAVLDELTATFGGGGGGSETLARGGGFDATSAEIYASLE